MKVFDKISFKLYSLIVLVLVVVLAVVAIKIVEVDKLVEIYNDFTEEYLWQTMIGLGIFAIWSLRNIFYGGKGYAERSNGILLENQNGKLLITKESISNLIDTVVKKNRDISNVSTKIEFDENSNLNVFLEFSVNIDASVKDVTSSVQAEVKDAVKRATDIDIKEINIKVRNIEQITIVQGEN